LIYKIWLFQKGVAPLPQRTHPASRYSAILEIIIFFLNLYSFSTTIIGSKKYFSMHIKIGILIFASTLLLGACRGKNENSDFKGIVVDVNKEYSKKELSRLQDIADVAYIPLEINDEYLLDSRSVDYLDDEIIVIHNNDHGKGNIFVFDRAGKPLKRINRLGKGKEEYEEIHTVVYDKENQELCVFEPNKQKLYVYDLNGEYKRDLQLVDKEKYRIENLYSFDREYLLAYVTCISEVCGGKKYFMVISKQTGAIEKEITYDYGLRLAEGVNFVYQGNSVWLSPRLCECVVKTGDDFLLNYAGSDTIYRLNSDFSISPTIVQTPSLDDLNPPVFLFSGKETARYHFMKTIVKDYVDIESLKNAKTAHLTYDKETEEIWEQEFYNDDYTDKRTFFLVNHSGNNVSNDINQYVTLIQADELAESYEKKEVQGKLKEIASKIDFEDNPVVMVVTFKGI
jgi:hypothetical protein